MHTLLRTGALIRFGILIICIIAGCGDDPTEEITDPSHPKDDIQSRPKIEVMVSPGPERHIPNNEAFTLTFNEEVMSVVVNGTPASGSGLSWKWHDPYPLPFGPLLLKIRWTNRDDSNGITVVGGYTVADVHWLPPEIVGATIIDGAVDVNPAPINAGGFRFDFDVPVTGTLKLTDEAGVDLNWIETVADTTATLTAIAGQELVNDTTYMIEIDVQGAAGDRLQETITFRTKPE